MRELTPLFSIQHAVHAPEKCLACEVFVKARKEWANAPSEAASVEILYKHRVRNRKEFIKNFTKASY